MDDTHKVITEVFILSLFHNAKQNKDYLVKY